MRKLIYLIALLVVCASCSKFQQILKNDDWRVRYNAAIAYYEKGDFYRAGILLEELTPLIKGTPEAEKGQFYWAYCYYQQGQYTLSAHYFKVFFDTYNRSEFAEESLYMHAYSLFQESPSSNLDQESTNTAIDAFQEFLNRYPQSKYSKQATGILDELRHKLENKAYQNAKLYHRLSRYKAAVIALENFQKDFPDSPLQEEVAFLKIESQYDLARNSFFSKKKERYEKVVSYYQAFIDKYPNSKYLRTAETYFDSSRNELKSLNATKTTGESLSLSN